MNVICYDLEIKRSKILGYQLTNKEKSVYELLKLSFDNELEISKGDVLENVQDEWSSISYPQLKAIYNNNNCCGYGTTENIKFFLFEKENSKIRSKNNLSIEVISFGNLDVSKILNHSYLKIKEIVKRNNLSCKYIDGSKVLIYPFNSQDNDIYSYELKVKAELISRFSLDKKVYSRWIIMFIGFLLALIYKNNTNSRIVEGETNSNNGIMDSLLASFIFYVLVEIVIYYIIPFFLEKNKKYLRISNLSSFVESGTNDRSPSSDEHNFETPNV